jgi:hypothetical protein
MAYGVWRAVLAIMFSLPLVAIAYSEAPAQERATCSQARSSCGKQQSAKDGTTPVPKLVAGLSDL